MVEHISGMSDIRWKKKVFESKTQSKTEKAKQENVQGGGKESSRRRRNTIVGHTKFKTQAHNESLQKVNSI